MPRAASNDNAPANIPPRRPIADPSVNNVPKTATEKTRQDVTLDALRTCGILGDPITSMDTRTLEALYHLNVIKQLSLLVNDNALLSVDDGPDMFKLQIWRKPSTEHEREEYVKKR